MTPHTRFIELLQYKAALVGVQVVVIEERYPSKRSFLDLELARKQDVHAGKRVSVSSVRCFRPAMGVASTPTSLAPTIS